MKKSIGIFVALWVLTSCFGYAIAQKADVSQFEGKWWLGMIEEANLPINLTFSENAPVLYSPLQSDKPMKATKWSFEKDTLRINHSATGVRLTLVWNSRTNIFTGVFRQGLLKTQMVLEPTDTMFALVRPQTPQAPFPYSERDVVIERKKAGVTLAGTLTVPEGKGPFPAVVLVSGSGQQNRDEELMGHKPFLVLADFLARRGIAVLRYDDRGVGGSKGAVNDATTLDFADDAEAVFEFLRKQKNIDPKCVGIVGHSEGGLIAPIVASRNKKVAFIVMMAGQGTTGADVLLQQNERLFELNGVPKEFIDVRLDVMNSFFKAIDTVALDDYNKVLNAIADEKSKDMTSEQRKMVFLRKGDLMGLSMQMQMAWMRCFVKLDSRDYLRKVRCPILALGGDRDCQVLPVNLDGIENATGGRARIRLLAGLNHLLQHCETGATSEYMRIEETMAREAMEEVSSFVKEQYKD